MPITKSKDVTNDRRRGHTTRIRQPFLKPNSWIQEFFYAEVTENWLKVLANSHEGLILLFKRLLLYFHHFLLALIGAEIIWPVSFMSTFFVVNEIFTDRDGSCAPLKNTASLGEGDHLR